MRNGRLIVRGSGPPLVMLPGIQGRWEWMAPAVDALARHYRVITFSLDDGRRHGFFDGWVQRIDEALDAAGVARAPIVGVSFGGVIAVRYTASRPSRVSRLVLVSTPGPDWRLDARSAAHARRPLLRFPAFLVGAAGRLLPETRAALPAWPARAAFLATHGGRVLGAPANPARMAAWAREWMASDGKGDAEAVRVPTLVITGEPGLDRVVPVESSLEYLRLIPGATHRTIPRTGHLGLVLTPDAFAATVTEFLTEVA